MLAWDVGHKSFQSNIITSVALNKLYGKFTSFSAIIKVIERRKKWSANKRMDLVIWFFVCL